MSSKKQPLSRQAALCLITADTKLFRDLVLAPHPEDFRYSAVLALMPYVSAFAYESANYIGRTDPAVTRVLGPNKEMLFWSRMRVKLTEDKYRTPSEVLENVEELVAINTGWFLEGHRGIRTPLKLIQPDIGVTFVNGQAVYTTHVAFLNLGLTKQALVDSSLTMDNLGPFLHDRSVNVGRYIRLLANKLNIDAHEPQDAPTLPPPRIWDRDMKSKRLYRSVASRVAPGQPQTSILLTWLLSQINVARVIVPLIARQNRVAALKVRFVILYQGAVSLKKLLDQNEESPLLLPDALETIAGILDAESVKSVLQYRDLRNDFVHYGVRKRMSSQLSTGLPLFGLVEAHTNGRSFEDLSNAVDGSLECFFGGLSDLLPSTLLTR